jgi:glutamyl-Q tRNA(Asp) synthetase
LTKRRFLPNRAFKSSQYRGRFAPSPTGPLHFGSLVAAVGSYLDAKHHQGKWLVRIEDLDTPRSVKGAADEILGTLEAYGLHWDEDIIYQSQRTSAYEAAFQRLQQAGAIYPCACSRREIADSALHGIDGMIYPGTCRDGMKSPSPIKGEGVVAARALAWRVRTDQIPSPLVGEGARERGRVESTSPSPQPSPIKGEGVIEFNDAMQGHITQHLESEIGDFVVKRADGLFVYQLAVVVDDAAQGITDVVRGADLLYSTPRQIYLQRLLGLPTPAYMHLPVAVNEQGEKLSKQTLAQPVGKNNAASILFDALVFLRQRPPVELQLGAVEEMLAWAVANWQPQRLSNCLRLFI